MIRHGQHVFMTVIAGSGYLVRMDTMRLNPHLTRLVTAADILAMSGFPVTPDQVQAAGCECMFSKTKTAPKTRTARSMKKQAGDAMHFTHVGSVFLFVLIKFHHLGGRSTGVKRVTPALASAADTLLRSDQASPAASDPSGSGASASMSGLLRAVWARRGLI